MAVPDNFSVTLTSSNTHAPVTVNLERYSLRATNMEVRIYSDANNYTLLNPLPEVPTFRGRITQEPTAFVSAVIKPNGELYARVVYGNWYGKDPATGVSSWEATIPTAYRPTNTYMFTWLTNMPQTVSAGSYPAYLTSGSYGGPRYVNRMQLQTPRRCKVVIDVVKDFFDDPCNRDIHTALSQAESKLNDADFVTARDHMICYQLLCVAIRTNIMDPYTSTGTSRLANEAAFWAPLRGSIGFNKVFAFTHIGGGVAYAPGDYSLEEASWYGGVICHEGGHNWWAQDYEAPQDYTGVNSYWHAMDGSGLCYCPESVNRAQSNLRSSQSGLDWVKYNYNLAPYLSPDYASTRKNQAVLIDVLLNDHDVNSNTLAVAAFDATTARGGSVTLSNTLLRYVPPTNFVGWDSFLYKVTDGSGFVTPSQVMMLVSDPVDALLGEWQFEESSGLLFHDSTGRGVDGQAKGSLQAGQDSVPGISGQALHFGGSGQVDFGNNFDPLDSSWSISLWFKPEAISGAQTLYAKAYPGSTWGGIRLYMEPDGVTLEGDTFGNLPETRFGLKRLITVAANTWYHVAGTLDRTANLLHLFVNGVESNSSVYGSALASGEAVVGNGTARLGPGFTGAIDDLRIYSKALSASEVQSLYNSAGNIPAGAPSPADGERNVALQPTLSWLAGRPAYQHDIYLGTNLTAVTAATTNSVEYAGRSASPAYAVPGPLPAGTRYYWRVDEVVNGGTLVPGPVWTFYTAIDSLHGGLKLQLSFNSRDTVGSTTYDRAGPPFEDGALYNSPVAGAGKVLEGLSFNGQNQYVECPALNLYGDTATFVGWFKRSGTQSAYAGLIFCRGGTTVAGLDCGATGELRYHWNDDPSTYSYGSGLVLPDGQWALGALVVTPARAVFYLGNSSGVLQSKTNTLSHGTEAFDGPLRIASDSTGGRNFKGDIDEVCVWRRALSPAEIGQLFSNGLAGLGIDGPAPSPTPGTFTWTGNSSVLWTDSGNWATNATPSAGDVVIFDNSATQNTATDLGTAFSIAGVRVNGSLRAVGIGSGNNLTLGTDGITLSNTAASLALTAPVTLGVAQTWTIPELGAMDVANVTTAGRTLTFSNDGRVELDGIVSGAGGLTFTGTGTTVMNRLNTYSGQTLVDAGEVVLNTWQWYGGSVIGSGALVIRSNAWVRTTQPHVFNGNGQNPIRLQGGRLTFGAEAYVNASFEMTGGLFEGPGEWRLQGNPIFRAAAESATLAVDQNLMGAARTYTVENGSADPDLIVSGTIYNGTGFAKFGAGKMVLLRPCNYSGSSTVSQGILQLNGADDLLPTGSALTVNAAGTFDLNGRYQTVGGLSGAGSINLGAGGLLVNAASAFTFSGSISGTPAGGPAGDTQTIPPGGLAKAGAGKLTFSSRQTYAGETWISSGTLALSGSGVISNTTKIVISSGASLDVTGRTDGTLNLAGGQTLAGSGTVLGSVNLNGGSAVSPGSSAGTLTTGSETWFGGASYVWEIQDVESPAGRDLLSINGTLTLQAAPEAKFVLKIVSPGALPGFDNRSNDQWTLASASGGIVGFNSAAFAVDASAFANEVAGGSFSISQSANSLVLNFEPAPATSPRILTVNNGLDGFSLSGTGGVLQSWILQATSNLNIPVWWVPLQTNTSNMNGVFQFVDPTATNGGQRFYRLEAN